MFSILFWNLAANLQTFASLARLATTHPIDVFFLAECPHSVHELVQALNERRHGVYRVADKDLSKIRGISRLSETQFFISRVNARTDLAIWKYLPGAPKTQVQVAVTHLPSKAGGTTPADQQAVAEDISREIVEYEDAQGCRDTILVGDLNMNPFDPGMTIVSALHATMSQAIADRPDRMWRKKRYRRFYNPMWGLFGDRTPGPCGSHYWESSIPSNQHWHLFDQVLLRPSLSH